MFELKKQYMKNFRNDKAKIPNRLKSIFGEKGKIRKETTIYFIEECAYWYLHPSGKPVRAPGHSERIKGSENGWRIDYGANTFLVGKAIERCKKTILDYIENIKFEKVKPEDLDKIKIDILNNVSSSVSNYGNAAYRTYPVENGHMKFGVQSICVDNFSEIFLQKTKINEFIEKYSAINKIEANTEKAIEAFQNIIDCQSTGELPRDYNYFIDEFKKKNPEINIKNTYFKKFNKLILYFKNNKLIETNEINGKAMVVSIKKTPIGLGKKSKKIYKKGLQSGLNYEKIDYMIQTLELANLILGNKHMDLKGKNIFFASLAKSIVKNGYDIKELEAGIIYLLRAKFKIALQENPDPILGNEAVQVATKILSMAGFSLND